MRVVIASVSHTGTNFCKRLFRDLGWEDCGFNQEPAEANAFNVGHIRNDDIFPLGLRLVEKHKVPLICPFRHPYRVEESWLKQGRGSKEDLISAFRLMFSKCIPLNPYIMPVDSDKREECLDVMSKGLGLPLKTKWEVVNSKAGTFEKGLKDFDPSPEIVDFTKEINQFLEKYYGKTRKRKRG